MNLQTVIKKILHTNPSEVLGVDIGTGSIKLVQIEFGNKPLVSAFAVAELPLELTNNGFINNIDSMMLFIKKLLDKYDFQAKHVVFTVGGRNAFACEISMPAMPDAEMKEAIAWDSSRYVPYEVDKYYLDAAKIGALTPDDFQSVLLVASPKDVIDALLAISDTVGWKPLGIDLEVLSACRTLPETLKNFVLLDIGCFCSVVTIFQNSLPVAQRSIPQGGQMLSVAIAGGAGVELASAEKIKTEEEILCSGLLTDKNKYADFFDEIKNLGREVRRTCEYYMVNKPKAKFTHLVLVGGGASLPGLAEFLNNELEMTVIGNDLRRVVNFSNKLDQRELKRHLGILTVAVGAALYGGETDA